MSARYRPVHGRGRRARDARRQATSIRSHLAPPEEEVRVRAARRRRADAGESGRRGGGYTELPRAVRGGIAGAVFTLLVAVAVFAFALTASSRPLQVTPLPEPPKADPRAAADFAKRVASATVALEGVSGGGDGIKIATFLGNESRRFYGIGPVPEKLEVIWRVHIGSGKTSGTAKSKGAAVTWSGTGWTGQATLVRDGGKDYILIGGFDHGLRKIDARTGKVIWRYGFDDVIKGTNTVFADPSGGGRGLMVVAGSRRGFGKSLGSPGIEPVRCVSFKTGKELWRLAVPQTRSYSRDADSSPLLVGKRLYEAVESSYFYALDPSRTTSLGEHRTPKKLGSTLLIEPGDSAKHGGNLVAEGSPAYLDGTLYIAAGSGHVYGVRASDMKKVWDFKTGSDLDATVVVNRQGRLLVGVERQYVPVGGALMLDPKKRPRSAVVWFFPTGNRHFQDWEGGIIGSVAINDEYNVDGARPALAAFNAIDGHMYVVSQDKLTGAKSKAFDGKRYPTPVKVYEDSIGGAISTPIIVDDHIVAAGYDAKVHVYRITYGKGGVKLPTRDGKGSTTVRVKEVASFRAGAFESTPIVWRGRIYIGSRNGSFYCLGEK